MPERRPRRRRVRSARRIALLDQVRALLRDSARFLTAQEVSERLGPRVYYSDVFPLLDLMQEEGTIVKLTHPLLRNVLWGFPSQDQGFAYEFALLRAERDRLHEALALAPEPVAGEEWIATYREWWAGERQDALGT